MNTTLRGVAPLSRGNSSSALTAPAPQPHIPTTPNTIPFAKRHIQGSSFFLRVFILAASLRTAARPVRANSSNERPGTPIGRHPNRSRTRLLTPGALIDLLTADGQRFRSRVLGLSYYDASSGQSLLFAEFKNGQAQLASPNR